MDQNTSQPGSVIIYLNKGEETEHDLGNYYTSSTVYEAYSYYTPTSAQLYTKSGDKYVQVSTQYYFKTNTTGPRTKYSSVHLSYNSYDNPFLAATRIADGMPAGESNLGTQCTVTGATVKTVHVEVLAKNNK